MAKGFFRTDPAREARHCHRNYDGRFELMEFARFARDYPMPGEEPVAEAAPEPAEV